MSIKREGAERMSEKVCTCQNEKLDEDCNEKKQKKKESHYWELKKKLEGMEK